MDRIAAFTLDNVDYTLIRLAYADRNPESLRAERTRIYMAIDTAKLDAIPKNKAASLYDDLEWHDYLATHCGGFRHDHPETHDPAFFIEQEIITKKIERVWIPQTTAHYERGKIHGLYKTWHPNGKHWEEAHYTHDSLNDIAPDIPAYQRFSPAGTLCRLEHYRDGKPVNVPMADNLPPFASKFFNANKKLVSAYDADTGILLREGRLARRLAEFSHTGDVMVARPAPETSENPRMWGRIAAGITALGALFRPF